MPIKPIRKKNDRSCEEVLIRSKRRCCICFGLHNDDEIKRGQIAHLDYDRSNSNPNNLAFLCLTHHDEYDSQTSQSKSLQIGEVKAFREKLYEYLASKDINGGDGIDSPKESKPIKSDNQQTARQIKAALEEKTHKCSYCGYSFLIMPKLEANQSCFIKNVKCPSCGNVDEVNQLYQE